MAGLEKILNEIENAASQEAEEILAKARNEAADILNAARSEAAKQAAQTEAETMLQVAEIERAQASLQQLTRRRRILKTKQEIISEVLEKAKEKLYALPGDEYFALLAKLAASAATAGTGAVLLNANDKKRLPSDFEARLSAMLPDGALLKISDETRPIDGGLILKYERIEQNCSFEAIFSVRRDEFSDLIRDKLFAL